MIGRFRKRRVRVHLVPVAGVDDLDFEGVWVGMVDGHYLIQAAKAVQGTDRSFSLENAIEVPMQRVWWIERLVSA